VGGRLVTAFLDGMPHVRRELGGDALHQGEAHRGQPAARPSDGRQAGGKARSDVHPLRDGRRQRHVLR
jgi:hypothetical protein